MFYIVYFSLIFQFILFYGPIWIMSVFNCIYVCLHFDGVLASMCIVCTHMYKFIQLRFQFLFCFFFSFLTPLNVYVEVLGLNQHKNSLFNQSPMAASASIHLPTLTVFIYQNKNLYPIMYSFISFTSSSKNQLV